MKVNILELIGSFERGGSERQAVQIASGLQRSGDFNVLVACLQRSGPLTSEIDWLSSDDIPEFRLSSFRDVNFLTQLRRCAAFIRENNISLIHTHDFYTNIFGLLSGRLAGVTGRVGSKRETFSKTKLQTNLERQMFRFADRIVVNAEAVKEFLINNAVPEFKPVVIYNGIDAARYQPSDVDPKAICERLGLSLSHDSHIVTIVANVRSDVKNHLMFLRSAKSVQDKLPSTEFIVAGEGELIDDLREEAVTLGIQDQVHFIGACSEVPALLSVSDVCVLSSRSEGFSNAILEYMAAGKPVVATRVGGAAEAIVEGETGFLVESDDDQMMSRRIIGLLENPALAATMGAKGIQRVKQRFSLDTQLEKTKDLYEEILSRDGKAR